jgi:hypothetical protein
MPPVSVLALRLVNRQTRWQRFKVNEWYGLSERLLQIVSSKAIWHHPGRFVPFRYVLVRSRGKLIDLNKPTVGLINVAAATQTDWHRVTLANRLCEDLGAGACDPRGDRMAVGYR